MFVNSISSEYEFVFLGPSKGMLEYIPFFLLIRAWWLLSQHAPHSQNFYSTFSHSGVFLRNYWAYWAIFLKHSVFQNTYLIHVFN